MKRPESTVSPYRLPVFTGKYRMRYYRCGLQKKNISTYDLQPCSQNAVTARYLLCPNLLIFAPVKFFFSILSFAMLLMSCLPCGDSQECTLKTEARLSAAASHEQHDHNAEACTPFCTCSCCATSAFFTPFAKPQATPVALLAVKHSLYDVTFQSEVFSSIWQPPQLS